ncbi:CBS domain-containing protein [Microbispora sp. NPDC049125]|uniref:CBS domain-containing protein n=1 Tax=Microbispora sp. NPDC049125 TaxID=3154929 RepID=UPI0034675674
MPMSVGDVMSRFVVAVETGASFGDVVSAMCRFRVDAVPVVDAERRVVGMVCDEDVLLREMDRRAGDLVFEGRARHLERRKSRGRTAAEIMSSPAVTVTEETGLRRAACLMHANKVRHLPVVDAVTGRVTGLVRQADLIKAFCRPSEEVRDDVLQVVERYSRQCAVRVDAGVVSLSGSVDRRSRLAAFVDEVWQVDGVVDVECDVSYATDDVTRAAPA